MSGRDRRSALHKLVFTVALMAVPVLGLGVGVLSAAMLNTETTEQPTEPSWMPVETATLVGEQQVSLDLTWAEPAVVRNPGWSGLITGVFVVPGDVVKTGTPVLEVNGIRRLAYSSEKPLFEPVDGESAEAGRVTVSEFLASLGYSHGGTEWNWAMLSGVREFANDIGVPSADEVTGFDPTWVVWIPAGRVRVGGAVPQVGSVTTDELFTLPAQLMSARPSQDETLPDLSAQDWQLTIGGSSYAVKEFPIVSPEPLAGFAAELGTNLPETATATLSTESSLEGWAVASSSVIVGSGEQYCVVVATPEELEKSRDTEAFRALEVELLAGSPPGVAWVGGRLPTDAVVLTRPDSTGVEYSCD